MINVKKISNRISYWVLMVVAVIPSSLLSQTPPEEFLFEQSVLQAFYYFNSVLDLQGNPIEPTDWVAAFKGDVCVGARQWDTSNCLSGVCDVAVMGDDGKELTSGYMEPGDLPTFKIYDLSENMYYDAISSQPSPWSNLEFIMADELNIVTLGCMDELAENYNSSATVDDGSCDFGLPVLFQFDQSLLQAFYFFTTVLDIQGNLLEPTDWVAAFKGDICVGARQWDTSLCGEGLCDVPTMGDDGGELTSGYMQTGDIPTFKIYDASEDMYYEAISSSVVSPWYNTGFLMNDLLEATEIHFLSIPLHKNNNLISFYILPTETNLVSVVEDIQSTVLGVVGEGLSSQYVIDDGDWVGSLSGFDTYSGYWFYMGDSVDTLDIAGVGINPNKQYELHEGLNLISFPVPGTVGIGEGIPDNLENSVSYILSESIATTQINGEWVGSLESFNGARGYWFNVDEAMTFQYDLETIEAIYRQDSMVEVENPFVFSQSEVQSFYFIDVKNIDVAEYGDWILAYHNDVMVGSRQWIGKYIDVPVMGFDGKWNTIGYPQMGDKIEFKLYLEHTNIEYPLLVVGHDSFIPNQVQIVESVSIAQENIPSDFYLSSAYPNPFNPETTVKMYVPQTSNIHLDVYDANGRHVKELLNETFQAGEYDMTWVASEEYPSGIYFIRLSLLNEVHITKVMLMK